MNLQRPRRDQIADADTENPMLAEAFILRLEANLRNANEQAITSRKSRLVQIVPASPQKDKTTALTPPK